MNTLINGLLSQGIEKSWVAELDSNAYDLLQIISQFSDEQFNTVPFDGSWTAGQVAEHLLKSESGIPKILRGNTRYAGRDPFEKTAVIQSIFLDFSTKLESPEFILPSDGKKDKPFFLDGFKTTRKEIKELVENTDLSDACTDFPFPVLGELTGWEWICFAICHSKRHTRQMKNIYEIVSKKGDTYINHQ
jgi:hypothetical protein